MRRIKEILSTIASKPRRLLGIDVRSGFIRVLELSYWNGEYQIEYCANRVIKDGLDSKDKVIKELNDMSEKAEFKTQKVAIAISHTDVIFKEAQVCADLSYEEILQFLEFNLEKQPEYPKESVVVDYQIDDAGVKETGCKTLHAIAVKEKDVDRLTGPLRAVGLVPCVVDVDIYVMERAARREIKKIAEFIAFISIDYGIISTLVLDDKKVSYIEEEFIGEKELGSLEQIARQVGLKLQLAGLALDSKIDKVMLAGERANLHGIEEAISNRLKVTVAIVDPFVGMGLGPNVSPELIKELSPMMLVSCGLALRVGDEYKD